MAKRWLSIYFLTLVLLAVSFIACGSDSKPKDTPKFAQGEAIALVKRNLQTLMINKYRLEHPGFALGPSNEQELIIRTKYVIPMLDSSWSSEYIGNGKWLVSCWREQAYEKTANALDSLSDANHQILSTAYQPEKHDYQKIVAYLESLSATERLKELSLLTQEEKDGLRYYLALASMRAINEKWYVYEASETIEEAQ